MIPYAELERAIARWKVRQSGGAEPAAPVEQPAKEVSAGAIIGQQNDDLADEPYAEVSAEQVEHVEVEHSGFVRFEK